MIVPEHVFRQYDIRGYVGKDLGDDFVYKLGYAIGSLFEEGSTLTLGWDVRHSSPRFCELLARGLTQVGINVLKIGMVPTPVLYYSLQKEGVDGGVMITGSHNPPDMNGFKICQGKFPLYGDDILKIRDIMKSESWRKEIKKEGVIREYEDIVSEYVEDAVGTLLEKELKFKVAIDAGNGVAGITAKELLEKVGCEVVPLYCEPDGDFPNHHPDPVYEKNLEDLKKLVLKEKCDIGFGFDGDGDRIGVVTKGGKVVFGDIIFLLLAKEVIDRKGGGKFVSEVKATKVLYDKIKEYGGEIVMWKAGHSLIKAKMREIGADLGAEVSGHIFFFDRYFGFDDGPYAGLRILEAIKRTGITPDELLKMLPETYITEELRVECSDDKKFEVIEKVKEICKEKGYKFIDIDGVRIEWDDGWALIRASNTQPALVYRAEGLTPERRDELKKMVEEWIKKYGS